MTYTPPPGASITLSGNSTTGGAGGALISTGTMTLAGGNNVTVSQDGNAVTISGAAAAAQTGISGISNSEVQYTSGTVKLSELGAITIRSTTGQAFQFSVNSQTVQTQAVTLDQVSIGVSTGGNTSGNTTVNTGNRFVLVGTNGITLSQGTGNSSTTVTISGITQSVQTQGITQDELSVGVSTGGNTAGNTTVQTGQRLVFVGTDNISLSQGTGAGSTTISVRNMFSTATSVSSVSSANAVGANNSRFALEAHVHEGVRRLGISTQGNTGGTTGIFPGSNIQLVGTNMISLSQSTDAQSNNTITFNATQSVQTQGVTADELSIGVSTGGNTGGNTTVQTGQRFVFVGSNMVSLSQATGAGSTTITISATQTNQSAIKALGASNVGNTAGNTGISTGIDWVLAGTNNITVSESTVGGGPNTLWFSAPNAGGGGQFSGGISTMGNTAGDTGVTGTRLVFVGTNHVSLSGATDANGGTISINDTTPSFSAGISTMGNTAGSTGVTGTRIVFVGSNDITLSGSTDANGATISVVPPAPLSHWNPWQYQPLFQTNAWENNSIHVQPYPVPAPGVAYDRAIMPVQYSQATGSTLTVSVSLQVGFYTKNAQTLSLLNSQSGSFSINGSGTASSNQNSGWRNMTMAWTTTQTAGDYWVATRGSTATAGANASLSVQRISIQSTVYSGLFGVASDVSNQAVLGLGYFSVSSGGLPNSIGFADLRGASAINQRRPIIWFGSSTA